MRKIQMQVMVALAVLGWMTSSAFAVGTGGVDVVSGWYPAGTNLTVTATPATDDQLSRWEGDTNSATFGSGTISFSVDGPRSITAVFSDIMHTIIASAGAGGSISDVGTNNIAQGDSLAFTITPDANYHISDVVVDSSSVGVTNSYTFSNVMASHTIAASFAIDTYEVNFLAGAHGALSGAPTTQTIDHGADATPPTVTPDAGYSFDSWNGTYTGITSARTLTALYTTNSYTLTFDSAGGSAVADITLPYGSNIAPPADPTRDGYTFGGWSPAIPATMPVGGQAHTAQWTLNDYSFVVSSDHGSPNPAVGTNWFSHGSNVDFSIDSPIVMGGTTQYVATGWVSTGSLTSGAGTNGSFTITNDTTMNWQWTTNYWINLEVSGE